MSRVPSQRQLFLLCIKLPIYVISYPFCLPHYKHEVLLIATNGMKSLAHRHTGTLVQQALIPWTSQQRDIFFPFSSTVTAWHHAPRIASGIVAACGWSWVCLYVGECTLCFQCFTSCLIALVSQLRKLPVGLLGASVWEVWVWQWAVCHCTWE